MFSFIIKPMISVFTGGLCLYIKLLKKSPLHVLAILSLIFINFHFFYPDMEVLQVYMDVSILVSLLVFLVLSIVIYTYIILLVGFQFLNGKKMGFFNYIKVKFTPMFTDLVRAYNEVLLFSLFLLLPGIYKYFKNIFVPYIALEKDEKLSVKEFDSLKVSKKLTTSFRTILIVVVLALLMLPVDFASYVIKPESLSHSLLLALIGLLPLLYHCLLIALYNEVKVADK